MATRYSRFLTSRGTPTFIDLPSVGWAPLPSSLLRRVRAPQIAETVLAGRVGGQETNDGKAIMQVTRENQGDRVVQRHPVQGQVSFLVLGHEIPVGGGHLVQPPGQEHPEPFGDDARGPK